MCAGVENAGNDVEALQGLGKPHRAAVFGHFRCGCRGWKNGESDRKKQQKPFRSDHIEFDDCTTDGEAATVGAVYDRAGFVELWKKRAVIDRAYSSTTALQ